jgi:NADH-quinone oxidoreductase subunit F
MVRIAHKYSEFLFVESCGQCTPCKSGTNQSTYYLHKLVHGSGGRADLDHALEGSAMAPHANRCYLPVEHSLLIPSIVHGFESEFVEHFSRGCRSCRDVVVPKIVDYDPLKAWASRAPAQITKTLKLYSRRPQPPRPTSLALRLPH